MIRRKNNKGDVIKKVAIGSAIAAGVGYLTGILTAPKSGKATRQDIKKATAKKAKEAEKELKKINSRT
jgi:gas vesicle protein